MNIIDATIKWTQYQFNCPKCGWPHWLGSKQLNHPKYIIVCDCGYVFAPKRKKKYKLKEDKSYFTDNQIINEVIELLVLYGYSKKESKSRVNKVFDETKNLETLFKDAILNG